MTEAESRAGRRRVGVWIIGAGGGLATTLVVGARAGARGLVEPVGMITETKACADLDLVGLDALVFGGHDVRPVDLEASAREIQRQTGTLPDALIDALRDDLAAASAEVKSGVGLNCGPAIAELFGPGLRDDGRDLGALVDAVRADLESFRTRHALDRVVVVNAASTEPRLEAHDAHASRAAFEAALRDDRREVLRASSIYAWAALSLGCPFINFTPSNAALLPAHHELARDGGVPFMGSDGKTGETLVKSALAPMFRDRDLRVLSWQGYNMLGDRDGQVLADRRNKESKISTKDGVLGSILGYPLHTHVGIDYVPSLADLKTAWDFVHFQGFLGFRMSLQFTWQGCDAILAAPLVLDMARLADLAARRGESGPMKHLACFFKSPVGVAEHDLHAQYATLRAYLARR